MSLGAEIGFAWIATALGGPLVILSAEGVGSPLAAGVVAPTVRAALRPTCGLRRRPSLFMPPKLWPCAVPASARLLVDGRSGEAALLAAPADAFRGFAAPAGMTCVFRDAETGEGLWLGSRHSDGALCAALLALEAGAEDSLDALARLKGGAVLGIRYCAGGAEAALDPLSALTSTDERQIDEALGAGRAVLDAGGAAQLAIPSLGGAPGFGLTVGGLEPGAPDPIVRAGRGVRLLASRDGALWRLRAAAPERGEAERLRLRAPHSPEAEIVSLWTEARPGSGVDFALWEDAVMLAAAEGE